MNNQILKALSRGKLIIFLGSGASFGSKNRAGIALPLGPKLAEELAEEASLPFDGESLDEVYAAAKKIMGSRLNSFFENRLRYCTASEALETVAKYPWARIYTLNIDDALEDALKRKSKQKIAVRGANDPIAEKDPFLDVVDVVKLNGSVDRFNDGLIFSPAEYAKATTRSLSWYEELGFDFVRYTFLFVGTKLNEPLMKYHIEQYKSKSKETEGISYVLTPKASEIEKRALSEYKLEHISGTLDDLALWLNSALPTPPTPFEVAKVNLPSYAAALTSDNPSQFLDLLDSVEAVRKDLLVKSRKIFDKNETIKAFYKGFKPTWTDILDNIPADLNALNSLIAKINLSTAGMLIPLIGPAGSGKTTLLMQAALKLSANPDHHVYFLSQSIDKFREMLEALDATGLGKKVFLFTDKLDIHAVSLQQALGNKRLKNLIVVGSERVNIWNNRTKAKLSGLFEKPVNVPDLDEGDATLILEKLEKFGNWTRLGKLSQAKRIHELTERSKKQLLIALMEATEGRGFEQIIESDYEQLGTPAHKAFLAVVGLATVHRSSTSFRHADRALKYMGVQNSADYLAREMVGIVSISGDMVQIRHPLYARHLFEKVIDPQYLVSAIKGNLHAFTAYPSPIIQHVPKSQAVFYKGILNHSFLNDILKGKRDLILSVYSEFEKSFENDGLYWLHYGLSYRDFGDQFEALDKLNLGRQAYTMEHTLHAYAQQLLIVGSMIDEKNKAYSYLKEAKEILEKVELLKDYEDTYPIVTLAEGHTTLVRIYEGDDAARKVAKNYANVISNKAQKQPDHGRLKTCWEKLAKYTGGGIWTYEAIEGLKTDTDFQ